MKKTNSNIIAAVACALILSACSGEAAKEQPEITQAQPTTVSSAEAESIAETTTTEAAEIETSALTTAEKIEFPIVEGMSYDAAEKALTDLGVSVKTEYIENYQCEKDTVMIQSKKYKNIKENDDITLYVSKWEGEFPLLLSETKKNTEINKEGEYTVKYEYDENGRIISKSITLYDPADNSRVISNDRFDISYGGDGIINMLRYRDNSDEPYEYELRYKDGRFTYFDIDYSLDMLSYYVQGHETNAFDDEEYIYNENGTLKTFKNDYNIIEYDYKEIPSENVAPDTAIINTFIIQRVIFN